MDGLLAGTPSYGATPGEGPAWRGAKEQVHAHLAAVVDTVDEVKQHVLDGCAHRIGAALRRHTLDAADRRREAGTLEFHDLLVLSRRVLRDPIQGPIVRASLHERYQRLLLDEFQDTDPIQIELAVRIAARRPRRGRRSSVGRRRRRSGPAVRGGRPEAVDLPVPPRRHLHVPGRPATGSRRRPAAPVELRANFRTVAPVITWVNTVFRTLLEEAPDTDVPIPSQPAYVDLLAQRASPRRSAPPWR